MLRRKEEDEGGKGQSEVRERREERRRRRSVGERQEVRAGPIGLGPGSGRVSVKLFGPRPGPKPGK